ncbi:DUF2591 domain-containing protein [Polaromonas naphthalenivorans]|uniref:DUF2591 domain-containing protein n=1 Tax=Polaromonas naphthalenivorans (strain CJ2) TaxID=365044 RepID=A1VV95_POLNA|nr:DUF2591 domain-containing protein [Polaromonas naphthalenivorans]ABM39573.1 hypothetical protein Pnap_4291 [Polaromonas naphthalenivorans CJ2]
MPATNKAIDIRTCGKSDHQEIKEAPDQLNPGQTIKVKTSELIGAAFNWAVAKCEGYEVELSPDWYAPTNCAIKASYANGICLRWVHSGEWSPATNWNQGGPIMGREGITTRCIGRSIFGFLWDASTYGNDEEIVGYTQLTAGMRCYVASKLGDEIAIPYELMP